MKICEHISWSSGLAKTILQDTVGGAKRRGRQRKRWEDNVKEWAGLDVPESQRAVEDRQMEAAGSEIIGGASTTLWVKGQNRD